MSGLAEVRCANTKCRALLTVPDYHAARPWGERFYVVCPLCDTTTKISVQVLAEAVDGEPTRYAVLAVLVAGAIAVSALILWGVQP
jgi:hypothetical protein